MNQYDGFQEFFETRRKSLSRTALLLTGDHAAAEDLLQEAITKTVGRWRRVSDGGNPEGYVRQVMLNEVRSRWRRHRRRPSEYALAASQRPKPTNLESEATDKAILALALRKLAPRQRAVLYLRFYEDLSEVETARLLGCSVGTVKSQTHDALARLRTLGPELLPMQDTAEVPE